MKQLALLLAVALVVAHPCRAAPVSGYVESKYNALAQSWEWSLSAEKAIRPWLAVGTTMVCYASDVLMKGGLIPSWAPLKQGYQVWAEARFGTFRLRLTDWCDHYLAQSGVAGERDADDLILSLRYGF